MPVAQSGVGFALLAGSGFAALTLLTQRQVAGLDSLHTAAFGCLVGGALLLPIAYELGMSLPWRLVLWFGDRLGWSGWCGAALIVATLAVSQLHPSGGDTGSDRPRIAKGRGSPEKR